MNKLGLITQHPTVSIDIVSVIVFLIICTGALIFVSFCIFVVERNKLHCYFKKSKKFKLFNVVVKDNEDRCNPCGLNNLWAQLFESRL